MKPEEKAKENIFKIIEKIRQIQEQSPNTEIEYHIGSFLFIDKKEEVNILNLLESEGIIEIINSWGSDSYR